MLIYTCNNCKKTFESDWSDEDALQEKTNLFPILPIEKMSLVCDDCFKQIMEFNEPGLKRYEEEAQR